MPYIPCKTSLAAAGLCLLLPAAQIHAQQHPDEHGTQAGASRPDTVVVPGNYDAGGLERALLGSGWRDVWTTAVSAPVLDLSQQHGGLTLEKRGGGFHTITLHLEEENGWREWHFRSVDKVPQFPPTFRGTLAGRLWADQTSVLFPAAPLMVPPLLEAIGAIHVAPTLYVMGDSPRLEKQRDSIAGMLGTFELKGQEAPDDEPGFAGSRKIKGTEKFLEDIASSQRHRLDEREFLAVRLVDFLVNDPDRTRDNFDWARFGDKDEGVLTWRPYPRDRDQAFLDARGLLNTLVTRRILPKQVPFGPTYELRGLTYTTHTLDRRLLQRLTAVDFRVVAERVRAAITDSVIAEAVARMPAEWRRATDADERIAATLTTRRDAIPTVAMEFYRQLAGEVDIHGTDEADRIEVFRHADGRITVTITEPDKPAVIVRRDDGAIVTTSSGGIADGDVFYVRTFLPAETDEVRVYAGGDDDVALVHGSPVGSIVVRLIGGEGDDQLSDSAGGRGTFLYDASEGGSDRLVTARGTRVDTRPWKPMVPSEGLRLGSDWVPDWGGSGGWTPAVDYNTGAGVIAGVGQRIRRQGFRRTPHAWEAGATLLVGTGNGRLGVEGDLDYRAENAPRGFRIEATATQLETTRFFGYGNDTPALNRDASLVDQTMFSVEPSYVRYVGWRDREQPGNVFKGGDSAIARYSGLRPLVGEIRVGPSLHWIDPDPGTGSLLGASGVAGASEFGAAGALLAIELDRTDDEAVPTMGWMLEAEASAYPLVSRLDGMFGTTEARGAMYLPLGAAGGPHLAFRAGGMLAAGDYPAQFGAAIGGRRSVRGYSWRRFAGDAALNGGAEFRVPVGTVNVIVRSQLGVFALADAGRVWFDGRSDGGWHSGVGGGVWLAALGRSFSAAYARGESGEGRFYLSSGLFY